MEADFKGGNLSADGGVLLLREIDQRTGMMDQLATCFTDYRDSRLIEHSVPELLRQRILGMAMGYEDLNDHDTLRRDPMMALGVGKPDPLGRNRAGKCGDFSFQLPVYLDLARWDKTLFSLKRLQCSLLVALLA